MAQSVKKHIFPVCKLKPLRVVLEVGVGGGGG